MTPILIVSSRNTNMALHAGRSNPKWEWQGGAVPLHLQRHHTVQTADWRWDNQRYDRRILVSVMTELMRVGAHIIHQVNVSSRSSHCYQSSIWPNQTMQCAVQRNVMSGCDLIDACFLVRNRQLSRCCVCGSVNSGLCGSTQCHVLGDEVCR